MPKRHAWTAFVAVAAVLSMLLCSCAAPPAMTDEDNERLRELSDALGEDLKNTILPQKERPDGLTEQNYVVSRKDYSAGTDTLAIFFADYKAKSDCEITMVFVSDSFVVSRVVFIGEKGYYLRYEYDKQNPASHSVKGQMITNVDLKYQKSPPKWTFTLYSGRSQRASFKFINPQ